RPRAELLRLGLREHQRVVLALQLILRLDMRGIDGNAVDRAHDDALRLAEVPDAFGAFGWIDDIDLRALRDRAVRAFGLADIAIDAFVGDDECHGWDLSGRPEESTFATGARPCPRASRGRSDARTRRRRP